MMSCSTTKFPTITSDLTHFYTLTKVFLRTVEVTISNRPRQLPHVNSQNRSSRPKAAQGSAKTDKEGQMGGSPKASATTSGRGNQPAGEDPESNICCLGFHENKVITTLAVKFRGLSHHLDGSGVPAILGRVKHLYTMFA